MKKITLYLCLIIFLITCAKKEKNDSAKLIELQFQIDSTAIANNFTDNNLGFQFNPPLFWNSYNIDALSSKNQTGDTNFVFHPQHIFANENQTGILIINTIESRQITTFTEEYNLFLKNQFGNNLIKQGQFLKYNRIVSQYLIQDSARVVFKLLFKNYLGEMIQFDYIIAANFYPSLIKAIESSIGTIKLVNNKGGSYEANPEINRR